MCPAQCILYTIHNDVYVRLLSGRERERAEESATLKHTYNANENENENESENGIVNDHIHVLCVDFVFVVDVVYHHTCMQTIHTVNI